MLASGQPVSDEVRDEQKPGRLLELGRSLRGRQLVDGVDGHELCAGPAVEPRLRDDPVNLIYSAGRPRVPVVVGIAEKPPPGVQKAVVDAPPVDAHTADGGRQANRPPQAFHDFVVQSQHVPVKAVGERDRVVREPVCLFEFERTGTDAADHHTP